MCVGSLLRFCPLVDFFLSNSSDYFRLIGYDRVVERLLGMIFLFKLINYF